MNPATIHVWSVGTPTTTILPPAGTGTDTNGLASATWTGTEWLDSSADPAGVAVVGSGSEPSGHVVAKFRAAVADVMRHSVRRHVTVVFMVGLLMLLTACGSGGDFAPDTSDAADDQTLAVTTITEPTVAPVTTAAPTATGERAAEPMSPADAPFPTAAPPATPVPDGALPDGAFDDVLAYSYLSTDTQRSVIFVSPGAAPVVGAEAPGAAGELQFSPDGRHVAVAEWGDAVSNAKLSIWSTETGSVEQEWAADDIVLDIWSWSPDSAAVVAATNDPNAPGIPSYSSMVYRVDGSTEAIAESSYTPSATTMPEWYVGPDGASYAPCTAAPQSAALLGCGSEPVTLVRSDNQPVLLYGLFGGRGHGVFTSADVALSAIPGIDANAWRARPCGRYASLINSEDGGYLGMFDADTGSVVAVPSEPVIVTGGCPAVAPDGSSFAFEAQSGPAVVSADGTVTVIANDGDPLMFSSDGAFVLLDAGSLYRVAADGSGGEKTPIFSRACLDVPLGVVVATGSEDVVYDLASGTSTRFTEVAGEGAVGIDALCHFSADGVWLQTASYLINVADATFVRNVFPPLSRGVHWDGGTVEVDRR